MRAWRSPKSHLEFRHLGKLFMVPVPTSATERSAVDQAGIPHFIIFSRDFKSGAGLQVLTRSLAARARQSGSRPLLAMDEEGGLVSQLRKLGLESPGPRVLAQGGTPALAVASATATAKLLRSLGLNVNFAPVADVDSAPANPVIGARAVSPSPDECGAWCARWIRAHQAAGVAATSKHFPGHGSAHADSHLTLPVINDTRALLKRRDLPPFLDSVRAGAAAVMTAHVRYPALDPRHPATLSPRILGLLRSGLGFDGVIVSDSLDMAGVRKFGDAEAPVQALLAGCDLLLYGLPGRLWQTGFAAVQEAAKRGRVPRARLEEALERLDALARKYPARPAARLTAPSAALRKKWDAAALKAVQSAGSAPAGTRRIEIAGEPEWASSLAAALESHGIPTAVEADAPKESSLRPRPGSRTSSADSDTERPHTGTLSILILRGRSGWRREDSELLQRWRRTAHPFGLVSLLSPARFHEPEAKDAALTVCPLEDTPRAIQAAATRIVALLRKPSRTRS